MRRSNAGLEELGPAGEDRGTGVENEVPEADRCEKNKDSEEGSFVRDDGFSFTGAFLDVALSFDETGEPGGGEFHISDGAGKMVIHFDEDDGEEDDVGEDDED